MKAISAILLWLAALAASAAAEDALAPPAKSLVAYYSFSGKTELVAQTLAESLHADLLRIEDETKPTEDEAYGIGRDAAVAGKSWPIQPFNADVSGYGRVHVGFPVWFGMPPPAINAFLEQVDLGGKEVVVFATMNSGGHNRAIHAATCKIAAKGAKVVASFSVRTGSAPDGEIVQKARDAIAGLPPQSQLHPRQP